MKLSWIEILFYVLVVLNIFLRVFFKRKKQKKQKQNVAEKPLEVEYDEK